MMPPFPLLCLAFFFALSCAETQEPETGTPAGNAMSGPLDFGPRPLLEQAEFTTRVDEKRIRPLEPPRTEFADTERTIYLVGKLRNLETDSRIEVHWHRVQDPDPLLVSEAQGSSRYSFIASFSPSDRRFQPGPYLAVVMVNGDRVGEAPFSIRGEEITSDSAVVSAVVTGLALSESVNRKLRPRAPSTCFDKGVRRVVASFNVSGTASGNFLSIRWFRGDEQIDEHRLAIPRNQRYSADLVSESGLPSGAYSVEISSDDRILASTDFNVGEIAGGPTIDEVGLGLVLGEDNLPKQSLTRFASDTRVIQCGVRFLDLDPGSIIEIQWVHLAEDGDEMIYRHRSEVASGGSGTMAAALEPPSRIDRGRYKAVVLVNGDAKAEASFTVE